MTNKYRKKSREELKKVLSDEEYRITQENGTEYPFRNRYNDNYEEGIYVDKLQESHYLFLLINLIQGVDGLRFQSL